MDRIAPPRAATRSIRLTLAVTLAVASLTSACKRGEKGGEDTGAYARQVDDALPRIEKSTGLTFKQRPKVEERTRDEVRTFLEQRFTKELPPEELTGSERAYKRFGLLPDTLDLRKLMLDLLTEQVAGYYDPATKTLYVVKGAPADVTELTLRHELIHALQDQYVNLDSILSARGDNDRQVAAQSVVEGQATLETMGGVNIATSLPGGWDRVRQLIREQQSATPVFASAPLILQETLLFPYLSGAEYVRRFRGHNPSKQPFDPLPASTEQVMHEDRMFGTNPDTPTRITLPEVRGKKIYENGLGEFETRLLLYDYLQDQASAVRGAAGWDGDRFVLVEAGRGSDALAWVSVWDTSIDAAEFFDLMDSALIRRFGSVKPLNASQTTRSYAVGGRTIALTAGDVGGRPVVMLVNVPQGTSTDLIDLRKVTLEE